MELESYRKRREEQRLQEFVDRHAWFDDWITNKIESAAESLAGVAAIVFVVYLLVHFL